MKGSSKYIDGEYEVISTKSCQYQVHSLRLGSQLTEVLMSKFSGFSSGATRSSFSLLLEFASNAVPLAVGHLLELVLGSLPDLMCLTGSL